jgi:hypothetical protein
MRVAVQVTYPLDIIRFRMAVDPTLNTIPQVVRAVIRDEGVGAFYKGLLPSCIGIAPYSSINFAAFDLCVLFGFALRCMNCFTCRSVCAADAALPRAAQAEEGAAGGHGGAPVRRLHLLAHRRGAGACVFLSCACDAAAPPRRIGTR